MPADNKIHFRCPECNSKVSVGPEYAGRRGRCPGCGNKVQVPHVEDVLDFDTLLDQSMEELRIKTAGHDGVWHLSQADWDLDQDTGLITFTAPNGMVATCPAQIIGTFNTVDGTWLWGWDHPSVGPALQDHAKLCKAYGEKHAVRALTSRKLTSFSEEDGWQFTALACKLAGAQGGYRGPMGTTMVFITFGQPSLTKGSSDEATAEAS